MLFIYIPMLFFVAKAGRHDYNIERKLSKSQRRLTILTEMMRGREATEERSIYGFTDNINRMYSEQYELFRKAKLKRLLNVYIIKYSGSIMGNIYLMIVMFSMLSYVIDNRLEFGMFVGIIQAVINLSEKLSINLLWNINEMTKSYEYMKDLTEFMKLDEIEGALESPEIDVKFNKIEFKNVSFRFPDTEKLILDNVSFTIEYGKHYSIVGTNGSGKTTITKLLTGLYSNYEGEILVDGHPLRTISQAKIKGLISVVYQDFVKYCIPLYNNIAIGNVNDMENCDKIDRAADLVGLTETIEKLPSGIDTPLGKIIEGGVDLSSGEWQRIAIARGIFRPYNIIVLDEPTAAIDPIEESRVYHKFIDLAKNKIAIIITHRLGSTKIANRIAVMDKGEIIDIGTHDDLMKRCKIYADMFNSQAGWYEDEVYT